MALAKNLKYLRETKRISQAELAKAINVSQRSISDWEMGRFEPRATEIVRLSEFFEVSLDEPLLDK